MRLFYRQLSSHCAVERFIFFVIMGTETLLKYTIEDNHKLLLGEHLPAPSQLSLKDRTGRSNLKSFSMYGTLLTWHADLYFMQHEQLQKT